MSTDVLYTMIGDCDALPRKDDRKLRFRQTYTVKPMGPVLALCLIRHKMCSLASVVSKREYVVPILAFHLCHEP
jgi:hypothetical protein